MALPESLMRSTEGTSPPENADNIFQLREDGPLKAHLQALKTHNARHSDAIDSEMKPKVTWSSLVNPVYDITAFCTASCLTVRDWHHRLSRCASSEPRRRPGHSLSHAPSRTNLPRSLVHVLSMSLTSTSSVPNRRRPLTGLLR